MRGGCPLVAISGAAAYSFKCAGIGSTAGVFVCVCVFSSDAREQRCGQDAGYTPSAHRSDPWHPPGDAHHRRRRAGHRLRLPPPDLCAQPLPHRGEITTSANQTDAQIIYSDYLFSGIFIAQ